MQAAMLHRVQKHGVNGQGFEDGEKHLHATRAMGTHRFTRQRDVARSDCGENGLVVIVGGRRMWPKLQGDLSRALRVLEHASRKARNVPIAA